MSETTKWTEPTELTDLQIAFPASVRDIMPTMEEIPQEFRRPDGTPWNKWQARWFFQGLSSIPEAKEGVDQKKAIRHLKAIQGSFEPKHEHKEAAVAYLASLWFVGPSS